MKILTREKTIFITVVIWRIISVFLVQTAHVPDEYWQSLEVAHRLAFGYGYLTWEWTTGIRSYIYPFFIFVLYRILAILHLDYVPILITLPRLLHAIVAAYADYRFYLWTRNKFMTFMLCINWYWYYCASRTIINSVETSLTIIALSIFPWGNSLSYKTNFLWIVCLLVMCRPTAAIIWIPLCLYHLSIFPKERLTLFKQYLKIGLICFFLTVSVDSYFYNRFIITMWEFFKLNVLQNIGDIYGKQNSLWYIFQGLPVLLGLHYILLMGAILKISQFSKHFPQQTVLLVVSAWTIFIYSLISHKEFRFLLPLLPMIIYICGSQLPYVNSKNQLYWRKLFIILIIVSNVIPGLYLSLIHQRGSLDIMNLLEKKLRNEDYTRTNILFLTPCHATPFYSHLHKNVSMKFLTCEPNIANVENYVDEADEFFLHPMKWLNVNYIFNNTTLPSHIIVYDNIITKISQFIDKYKLIGQAFHSQFPESNYGKYILLYERKLKE